ncbi:MAG: ABC transporter ATP-binding protein [Marmoricola sp.]
MTTTITAAIRPTPSTTDPVIAAHGLAKGYGDRRVLTGLDLEVRRGEIFGILGPNGAGKTTTVEILQGLRAPDGGRASVVGLDPATDADRLHRRVGCQLQSSALPERMRVDEALRLFARLAGDVVDWRGLMAEWDLARLARTPYRGLSGGEQQRLFLALALVNDPELVFLDELTQGLDPAARRSTWRLVERVRDRGTTIVLISHYMDEVERLCDRVGVLAGGRIDQVGTPDDLVGVSGGLVRTRFTGRPGLTSDLTGLPGVDSVETDGGRWTVAGDGGSPVHVAARLAELDVFPQDLRVDRPTLEDVLCSLAGEEVS